MAVTKSGTGRKSEGLGQLLMGFDVQDGIFCESFSSKHCGIEKRDLFLWHFSRKFDSGVEIVCSFNKPIYLFCVAIPKGENVIYETFPFSWLGSLFWIDFVSISDMKILANDTAIFVPIAVPCVWKKFSSLNWNEFSLTLTCIFFTFALRGLKWTLLSSCTLTSSIFSGSFVMTAGCCTFVCIFEV